MMNAAQAPRFVENALVYWHSQLAGSDESVLTQIDKKRHNLFVAIRAGLTSETLIHRTAALVSQAYELVELKGRMREWLPYLKGTIDVMQHDEPLFDQLQNQLGFILSTQGHTDEAIALHDSVRQKAADGRRAVQEGYASFGLAMAHWRGQAIADAERWGQMARTILRQAEADLRTLALVESILGQFAQDRGDHLKALKHYQQVIDYRRQIQRPTELARSYRNMASVHLALEQFEEAQALLDQALQLVHPKADLVIYNELLLSTGHVAFEDGDMDQAANCFSSVDRRSLEQRGQSRIVAMTLNNLGNVRLQQSRWLEAEHLLAQAIHYWEYLQDLWMAANSQGDLAISYFAQNRVEDGRGLLEGAIDRLAEHGENAWARKRYHELLALDARYA